MTVSSPQRTNESFSSLSLSLSLVFVFVFVLIFFSHFPPSLPVSAAPISILVSFDIKKIDDFI